jgi:Tol biopolymer transport system component
VSTQSIETVGRTTSGVLLTLALGAALAAVGVGPAEADFSGANGKIVFASDRTTGATVYNPTGHLEIFTMNPDGSGLKQLTFNTTFDTSPSFSADGLRVVFASARDGNYEIYTMTPESFFQTRLTNNVAADASPAFSPDGKKIAFESNRDGNFEVYVMKPQPEGRKNRPVNRTKNPATDYQPDWQPLVN